MKHSEFQNNNKLIGVISKKSLQMMFLILVALLMLKIDYRFVEYIGCCGDDHDYYIHAETIAIDFDLDYSNQLTGNESSRFYKNDKIAPIGFIGTGLLSSPFLFIGNMLQNYYLQTFDDQQTLFNLKILMYSFSSVFYLFLTYVFLIKTLIILKLNFKATEVLLFLFGSGISYYAFERYSMTHIYEGFVSTLILYYSLKFYSSYNFNKFYPILIPILIFIGISIKWVNYFFFLIPFFAYSLLSKNQKISNRLISSPGFFISTIFSTLIFFWHTKILYGEITFNPQFVYGVSGKLEKFISSSDSFISFIFESLKNILIIFFSEEFGLVWFSPILFFSFLFVLKTLIFKDGHSILFKILLFLSFAQILSIVLMWKSTASSYGYRYLFCLVPISIILYFYSRGESKSSYIHNYLLLFSIFSLLSVLFFETTTNTQLSTEEVLNSFEKLDKYSQPNYLTGYLSSFFSVESYLKIFTTSFLGAITFKFLISLFGVNSLLDFLSQIGLPTKNTDFIKYLDDVSVIHEIKFIFVIFLIGSLVFYVYRFTEGVKNDTKT